MGARCTVRDKLRGQIYSAAALGHKHTHSFGIRLSCKVATGFCQILANLLSCQDLFSACDNRYGDRSPCFIAGSLVVKSYVSDLCACCACQPWFQCRKGALNVLKPRFSFFFFVLNLCCQGYIINIEFCLCFCRCSYYLGVLSHRMCRC